MTGLSGRWSLVAGFTVFYSIVFFYSLFLFQGGKPGLKKLAHLVLGIDIQSGEHSSVSAAY